MADRQPRPRSGRSPALEVDPVVGISEPEFDTIGVIAIAIFRRAKSNPELAVVLSAAARHHGSAGSDRVRHPGSDFKRSHGDLPFHEHRDDDRGAEPAFVRSPDQDLIAELLLH